MLVGWAMTFPHCSSDQREGTELTGWLLLAISSHKDLPCICEQRLVNMASLLLLQLLCLCCSLVRLTFTPTWQAM
jgi:hypothetical protein